MRRLLPSIAAAAVLGAAAACEPSPSGPPEPAPEPATGLAGTHRWVLEGFAGAEPLGFDAVDLAWQPPAGSPAPRVMRVFGRPAGGQYAPLGEGACGASGCALRHATVQPGARYEYFVATLEAGTSKELGRTPVVAVDVPAAGRPATPARDSVVALDHALWVRWHPAAGATSYRVYRRRFLTRDDPMVLVAETPDTTLLDASVPNAEEHAYGVAAVDAAGRVSALTADMRGIARPDSTGVVLHALSSDSTRAGFHLRFGVTPASRVWNFGAMFYVDADASGWRIAPVPAHQLVEHGPTTALACGPESGPGCTAATWAPASGYVAGGSIPLRPGHTYVIREMLAIGTPAFGAIRVRSFGTDAQGRPTVTLDWSHQQVGGDRRL